MAGSIAIENTVVQLATTLAAEVPRLASFSEWTQAVWATFEKIVREHNETHGATWTLYPRDGPFKGELLLDFVIYEERYGPRIVCESQWQHRSDATKAIDWAFDKLRLVKSDIKVLLYETGEDPDGDEPPRGVNRIVKGYLEDLALTSSAEAYLLLNFCGDGRRFAHWWKPVEEGNPKDIRFSPIKLR